MSVKIGVIGAGYWGTSLSQVLSSTNESIILFSEEKDVIKDINKNRTNSKYLPDVILNESIEPTNNLKKLLKECSIIYIAVPTESYKDIFDNVRSVLRDEHIWVIGSKGFDPQNALLPSQLLEEIFDQPLNYATLSGPVFAKELIQKKPCALTIQSYCNTIIEKIDPIIQSPYIRLYYGKDPIGAQLCGALKNIIAIAAGLSDGLELGNGARAAIISRGITEIERYVVSHGGEADTVRGLSGAGDIIMASTSENSRHYRFGKLIGQGHSIEEAQNITKGFLEGTRTCRIVIDNSVGKGIDLALISIVDAILHEDITPKKGFEFLLMRPRGYE